MTPETRAARDRIAAFLGVRGDSTNDLIDRIWADHAYGLWASDLHALVAALDQQPDGIITCDHVMTEAQAEDLKRRFLAAQHDGTPVRLLAGLRNGSWLDAQDFTGMAEADDLVRSGACTAVCLLASEPGAESDCTCPCKSRYHGALATTLVPVGDAEHPPSIDPGMSTLGESYEERRDAYRAARREQHPTDPQTSDDSKAKGAP